MVQLRVAEQHRLVIPGIVGLLKPDQHLGLEPGKRKGVRQRLPYRPVPIGTRARNVISGLPTIIGQRRDGMVWLHREFLLPEFGPGASVYRHETAFPGS